MSGLRLESLQPGIYALVFDRTRVKNAIDSETIQRLSAHLDTLEALVDLRVLIVTGAGSDFVSGGDLKELSTAHDRESGQRFSEQMTRNLDRLAALPVPVIAAIEGVALGGGMEIALACDLRIAAEDARLGFRQVRMGLCPGWGGGLRLFHLVGRAKALRLLWEGQDLDAQTAQSFNLVEWVVDSGTAFEFAKSWAQKICKRPPLAVQNAKAVIRGACEMDHQSARAHEHQRFLDVWVSADHDEAVAAFLEKRKPKFSG